MTDVVIAELAKNKRDVLRIALRNYEGHDLVDVRVCYPDGGEQKPTSKGVSLAIGKLPELRAALDKAEAEARRRGLL